MTHSLFNLIRTLEAEKVAAKKYPTHVLRLELEARYNGNLDKDLELIKDQIEQGDTINQKYYKTK